MKINRQRKILELIKNNEIDTQQDLAKKLIEEGFEVTQATVSRDIRELNLAKIAIDGNKQKYILPSNDNVAVNNKYMRVLKDGMLSFDTAGNILVVKTVSGMAMAVGAAIDALNHEQIIGCIAGDDTIMCVIKDASESESVKAYLENLIK